MTCEPKDRDRYGRIVAVCRAYGEELSAWMTGLGWALAFRRYSEQYVPAEELAQRRKAGMWSGQFVPPWEWRAEPRGQNQTFDGSEPMTETTHASSHAREIRRQGWDAMRLPSRRLCRCHGRRASMNAPSALLPRAGRLADRGMASRAAVLGIDGGYRGRVGADPLDGSAAGAGGIAGPPCYLKSGRRR